VCDPQLQIFGGLDHRRYNIPVKIMTDPVLVDRDGPWWEGRFQSPAADDIWDTLLPRADALLPAFLPTTPVTCEAWKRSRCWSSGRRLGLQSVTMATRFWP